MFRAEGMPDCPGLRVSRRRLVMGKRVFMIFLLFFVTGLSLGLSSAVCSEKTALQGENERCLGCHGDRGIIKEFQNKEFVDVHVDSERYKASVHSELTCSACHNEFSGSAHPTRVFESKKQYRMRASAVCRRCHDAEHLKRKAVHERVLGGKDDEGNNLICTDCHDAHATFPAKGGKTLGSEREYCLNCHAGRAQMVFRDGEVLTAGVDPASLQASVHRELSCSDCHFGFSSKEHPKRKFRTKRDFQIASTEICRRCHFDKYSMTLESIHFTLLNQGNLSAPVCTDCHGSHSIREGRVEKILSGKRCKRCHSDIYSIYARSVHGRALIDEHNQDVPICVDCHKAHDIGNPLTTEWHERIPEMCANCHANKKIVGKYGLSTDVVKTYLSDFHGVTLKFYKMEKGGRYKAVRPIAVCTDCHGTHDISKTTEANSTIIKANLVKRCQKCHKDAGKDFPNAWLSHYESSMKRAPLVFVVNVIYEVFMPVLIIGLLLQVLLHIWRYAINR
jgi:predicted CXXCH cytochrome family protein